MRDTLREPLLRRDPIVRRWVISGRIDRNWGPDDFTEIESHEKTGKNCPFCPNNEKLTPPEVMAKRAPGTLPDTPGWNIRVVPNKYPALKIEGALDKRGIGLYDMSNGVGAHEVIIETPDHFLEIPDMDLSQLEDVIWAYQQRSLDLRKDKRFDYILIFKNYGRTAGASLEHSHSQVIALPGVPKRVKEELKGSFRYFEFKDRCIFCDIIQQELYDKVRLVTSNTNFIASTPFVSRFPFEVWIMPYNHQSDFAQINEEEKKDLAQILKEVLSRIRICLKDPSYNFVIHTSPLKDLEREDYHWHIELFPKLLRIAGFEWGSGFYINPTPPEEAAEYLRNVK
jgi:UDPglucose--hexose-1-phosphate uridylyltransferase